MFSIRKENGGNPVLYDCQNGKILYLKNSGKTEQKTLTGKNLFDKDNADIKGWYLNNGVITSLSGYSMAFVIPCNASTTYTISKITSLRCRVGCCSTYPVVGNTCEMVADITNSNTGCTFTTTSTSQYIVVQYMNNASETYTSVQILESLQLEQGTTKTDYEPFCGGIASPNPDYPQDIYGVGDKGYFDGELLKGYLEADGRFIANTPDSTTNSVKCNGGDVVKVTYEDEAKRISICAYNEDTFISRESITTVSEIEYTMPTNANNFKVCIHGVLPKDTKHISVTINGNYAIPVKTTGKNIFDINKRLLGGIDSNGDLKIDGSVSTFYDYDFKENTQYTFSGYVKNNDTTSNVRFVIEYADGIRDTVVLLHSATEYAYKIHTSRPEKTIKRFYVTYSASGGSMYIKGGKLQIEEGTEATPYQPYQETTANIPITSPLYEGDYLEVYADGSGKLVRNIGSVTVDITSITTLSNGLVGGIRNVSNKHKSNEEYAYCEKAVRVNSASVTTSGSFYVNPVNFVFVGTAEDTLETLKEKYDGAKLIYYLAEPTETPLTAEQVAEFMKLQTFKPVTHVFADGEVDVTYKGTVSKELINADDTQKKVILSFPNSDIEDITNSQIYSESMSLEESLIEQSDIKFGKCNASVFKIRVANIDANLEGLDLSVSITFSNASLGLEQNVPIGVYKIRTAERSADRKWKDIVAYDYMTKFDVDIADWYNTVAFPTDDTKVLCKTLIAILCDYVGVSYDTNYNFTFGDLEISKNILPTSLSGRDFLQQLLEFNCCFGHFNELGVLSFIEIAYYGNEYLYPSSDLYPSDEVLGGVKSLKAEYAISLYKTSNFEEYEVLQPNGVSIKMEDDSIGVQVGAEISDRTYNVIGNACLYGFDTETLQEIATTMLSKLSEFYYTPNVTEIKGGIALTLGTSYEVEHKFGAFKSYVLKRSIKGIQALYSTLESNAVEYATETSNIITEMSVIKGKTAKVKRDIDSLTVEYQDFTEQTRTQFEQSAEQFSWLVADNFSESNVLLSADAYTAIANNIVLQGNHIILDGDTTVTEGFTLTADNLDVNSIFAEDITATGTITGATLTGASGNFTKDFTVDVTTEKVLDDWDTSVIDSDYYIYMATDGNEITYANESDTYVDFYNLCVEYGGKIAWVDTSTGRVTIPYRIMWDVPEDYTTPAGVNLTWAHYINLSATTVVTGYNKILINEEDLLISRQSYPNDYSSVHGIKMFDSGSNQIINLFSDNAYINFMTKKIGIDGTTVTDAKLSTNATVEMHNGAAIFGPLNVLSNQVVPGTITTSGTVTATNFYASDANQYLLTSAAGVSLANNGNLYMPWAGDWLSNVLAGKLNTTATAAASNCLASTGYGNGNLTYLQTADDFASSGGGWAHFLIGNHGDGSSYYNFIIALPFTSNPKYRRLQGGNATAWYNFYTDEYPAKRARTIYQVGKEPIGDNPVVYLSSDGFFRGGHSWQGGQDVYAYDWQWRLGSPNYRWGQIYSTSATISTSDRNQKKNINELDDRYIKFFMRLLPVSFEFKEGTSGRTHIGFIAQDVEEAMIDCGLSDLEFAGFCKDKKRICKVDEEDNEYYEDILDEDGNVQYIYSLRYEEFIALNTKAIQHCMDRIDKIEELLGGNENA